MTGLNLGPVSWTNWSPPLTEILGGVLSADYGYEFERTEGDFRFEIATTLGRCRAQLILHEEEQLLRYYVFPDTPFLEFYEKRVVEITARLSTELVGVGSFEYDFADRFAFFRAASRLDLSGDVREQVRRLLDSAAFPLELWNCCVRGLDDIMISPSEVVNLALVNSSVAQPLNLSSRAVRRLLSITR
jgi:hypothetical protein